MFFAAPLAVAAFTAGTVWLTKKNIESSKNWEGKIEFYNYMKSEEEDSKLILGCNKGKIIKMNIMNKDVDGSYNTNIFKMLPVKHLALILKTDMEEYWSIEKNDRVIKIQKSDNKIDLVSKLNGKYRNTSLKYDMFEETKYFKKWNIDKNTSTNIESENINLNDVIQYINKIEIGIHFSLIENCNLFIERVIKFIHNKLPVKYSYYDYSLKKSLSLETITTTNRNVLLYKVKILRKTCEVTTDEIEYKELLFKTHNGVYWSVEFDFDSIHIQKSRNKTELMEMLNGNQRKTVLEPCSAGYRYFSKDRISDELPNIKSKEIRINDFLNFLKNTTKININTHKLIDNSLEFLYETSRLENIKCYNYNTGNVSIMLRLIPSFSSVDNILDASLWSKLATEDKFDEKEIFPDKCLVLIVQTVDGCYWSFERNANSVNIQKSKNKTDLIEKFEGLDRNRELHLYESLKRKSNCEPLKMKGFLMFILKIQEKLSIRKDFIDLSIKYLGSIAEDI